MTNKQDLINKLSSEMGLPSSSIDLRDYETEGKNEIIICAECGDSYQKTFDLGDGETMTEGMLYFSYWNELPSSYELGVLEEMNDFLDKNGWYAEWENPGTIILYPSNGESLEESLKEEYPNQDQVNDVIYENSDVNLTLNFIKSKLKDITVSDDTLLNLINKAIEGYNYFELSDIPLLESLKEDPNQYDIYEVDDKFYQLLDGDKIVYNLRDNPLEGIYELEDVEEALQSYKLVNDYIMNTEKGNGDYYSAKKVEYKTLPEEARTALDYVLDFDENLTESINGEKYDIYQFESEPELYHLVGNDIYWLGIPPGEEEYFIKNISSNMRGYKYSDGTLLRNGEWDDSIKKVNYNDLPEDARRAVETTDDIKVWS